MLYGSDNLDYDNSKKLFLSALVWYAIVKSTFAFFSDKFICYCLEN